MERKKSSKVLKHTLCDPFLAQWPEVSADLTQSILNVFTREIASLSFSPVRSALKISKVDSSPQDFLSTSLIYGVNKILSALEFVSLVILLKAPGNEVLIEPLIMSCRYKDVPCLCLDYSLANAALCPYTGVKRLAAFAFKSPSAFPSTCSYITSLMPPRAHYERAVLVRPQNG